MKKSLIILSLLSPSLFAQSGVDFYSRVKDSFDKAKYFLLDRETMGSAKVGRCFSESAPNKAFSAAMVIQSAESAVGPFGKEERLTCTLWNSRRGPEFYDSYDFAKLAAECESGNGYLFYSLNSQENAMESDTSEGKSSLRQDAQYIYEKIVGNSNTTYCYYFRSVLPKEN